MSKLRQWRDNVRIAQRRGRQRVTHDVEYAMPFPRITYEWFCDMYNLTMDDNATLDDMIHKHAASTIDIISAGTHYEIVSTEHQINTMGTVLGTTPQISKLVNGSYTGTLEYIIEYNKPTAMLMEYPIMVHQKVVPDRYLPKTSSKPNR